MTQQHYGIGDNIKGNKIINLNYRIFFLLLYLLCLSLACWMYLEYLDRTIKSNVSIVDVSVSPINNIFDNLSNSEIDIPTSFSDVSLHALDIEETNNNFSNPEAQKSNKMRRREKLRILGDSSFLNGSLLNKISDHPRDDDFPELTFILDNKGNTDAFIHEYKVELFNIKPNKTPVLNIYSGYCSEDKKPYEISSRVDNYGWGDANNLKIIDIDNVESHLPPEIFRENNLKSGDRLELFNIPLESFKSENPTILLAYKDENNTKYKYHKEIHIGEVCCSCVDAGDRRPDAVYVSLFDFDKINKSYTSKNYDILRDVPQRGADVLSIKLGINKSSFAQAVFSFKIDDYWISSNSIDINIWNPINSGLNGLYEDGQIISEE